MNDYFLKTKHDIEDIEIKDELSCLRTISLNVTDICNKKCVSCPHSKGFDNINIMLPSTAYVIAERIKQLPFSPRVTISGMGEPFMNVHLHEIIRCLKDFKPTVITNGTIAPSTHWKDIEKDYTCVVSVHDVKELPKLKENFPDATFRNHDINSENCELIMTNRGGWFGKEKKDKTCSCPFYKVQIDYDGSYLLCADDWQRISRDEEINIFNLSIEEYFTEYLHEIKNTMIEKRRTAIPACEYCNISGLLMGEKYVDWYRENKCRQ